MASKDQKTANRIDGANGGLAVYGPGSRAAQLAEHRRKTTPVKKARSKEMADEGLVVRLIADEVRTAQNVQDGPLQTDFYFQCPPLESFAPVYGYQHSDINVIDGQISTPSGRLLRTVTFNTLFVDYGHYQVVPYLKAGMDPASAMRAIIMRLEAISESGTPFRLQCFHRKAIFRRTKSSLLNQAENVQSPNVSAKAINQLAFGQPPINYALGAMHELIDIDGHTPGWLSTLRNLTVTENHGEGDSRYIEAEFHEYRDQRQTADRGTTKGPWTRTLTDSDSLHSLAQRYYHSTGSIYYDAIYQANAKKFPGLRPLRGTPNASIAAAGIKHLGKGDSLKIPSKPASDSKRG